MIPMIGPKWSMISMGLPAVGGWVLLAIGLPLDESIDPVWLFYMGRILTGIGEGMPQDIFWHIQHESRE